MDADRLRRRDRVCRATAAPQFGALNYKQAIRAGHTDDSLRRQVASGVLSRPIPRVYVYQGSTPGWRQDAMIGHLFLGSGSALSHSSAGHLHGLFGFPASYPIHFSVVGNIPGHRPDFIKVHRGGPTLVDYIKVVAGIPVTSPCRTLLDLGAWRHPRLEDGLDNLLRTERTSLEELWWADPASFPDPSSYTCSLI